MSNRNRGSRTSLWRVSGVAAGRFSDLPYARYVLPLPARRLMVRVTLLTSLGWSGWRANDAGTAVCGLKGAPGRRRRLASVAAWGALGLTAVCGWVAWVAIWSGIGLLWVPAASFLSAFALLVLLGIRALRVSRAKTALPEIGAEPRMPLLEVHMVASEQPGAGRRLLEVIEEEADRNGWALLLDAANDRLAGYYGSLGFQATGPAALMPYGERVTRMMRRPAQAVTAAFVVEPPHQPARVPVGQIALGSTTATE